MSEKDRIAQMETELNEKHAKLVEIADKLRAERAAHAATKATLADVEARLLAAQGEAAAMRATIKEEVLGDAYAEDWPQCVRALATDAGRAIAERVPLWRELETIMRIDGNVGLIDDVLAKLAALDAKGGG